MGCHTLIHGREDRSIDEIRKSWIDKYRDMLTEDKSINREIYTRNKALYKWRKRRLKMLKLIIRGKKSYDKLILDELTFTYKGIRYSKSSTLGDGFLRIFDYPSVILDSYESTMEFIEQTTNKNNDPIFVDEEWIKCFWINNPKDIIRFG